DLAIADRRMAVVARPGLGAFAEEEVDLFAVEQSTCNAHAAEVGPFEHPAETVPSRPEGRRRRYRLGLVVRSSIRPAGADRGGPHFGRITGPRRAVPCGVRADAIGGVAGRM